VRTPRRDGGVAETTPTAQVFPTCRHHNARLRAEALAFNLAAVNAGRFPPSTTVLDSLERLAWSTVWDLAVAS
jgi:hypothetical protein